MNVERDMMLSYELTIEKVLELIKNDILKAKETRHFAGDRIHIKTKIYT